MEVWSVFFGGKKAKVNESDGQNVAVHIGIIPLMELAP